MLTTADRAIELAEGGFPVFPLGVGAKIPAVKGWPSVATTDAMRVVQLWSQFRNANIGIATGGEFIVIDIDGPEAQAWWDELGVGDGLRVRSPRKNGGVHHYFAVEPGEGIQTNNGKGRSRLAGGDPLHPGIDVRGEGGLVVGPGSMTIDGEYIALDAPFTIHALPDIPPKLLDLLPRQRFTSKEIDPQLAEELANTPKTEAATRQEAGQIAWIIDQFAELPRPWRKGAGWRDTAFRMSCWLWRMVNSPHYAITAEQARALVLEHCPTDERWGQAAVLEQFNDAQIRTAGQVAERPVEARPPLLEWEEFPFDKVFPVVGGETFASLWNRMPEKDSEGARWAHRQLLLKALLRAGYAQDFAATMVWNARAAKLPGIKFGDFFIADSDSRYITLEELWHEVDQAVEALHAPDSTNSDIQETAPANERPSHSPKKHRHEIVTDEERRRVAEADWWGSRFLAWAEETFSLENMPYFRTNRWAALSIVFSPHAKLPGTGGNHRPLNLYQAIIGETTSGKTEALRSVENILAAYYTDSENPDIGDDASPTALIEKLIERDGKSSWFHVDEAHTKIASEWKNPRSPFKEMPGTLTKVYDGKVRAILRATKKDISGRSAQCFVTVQFMGTPQGMADAMDPSDWESGFLNRFVWTLGDPPLNSASAMIGSFLSEEDLAESADSDGDAQHKKDLSMRQYQQWAGEFSRSTLIIRRGLAEGETAIMRIPRAILQRQEAFAEKLIEIAESSPYRDRLRPTFRRFQETIMRCAALVALSRGSLRIEELDHLIALEQAEEWLKDMLIMVEATDESLRTREVNMIEKFVINNGGRASLSTLNRLPRFENRRRDVDDLIAELVAQGRVDRKTVEGTDMVVLKGVVN